MMEEKKVGEKSFKDDPPYIPDMESESEDFVSWTSIVSQGVSHKEGGTVRFRS